MAALSTQPNPLKFTGVYNNREAIWPTEPDISIIKSLALKHLGPELPDTLNSDRIEVHFFNQGAFNKLYSISCYGHPKTYLLRVALPLVPYYKIESEAAVLSYIKDRTSIPVARVVGWDSSAANDLGFEWILLEMIDGVALCEVWRKITWDSKLKIVAALASFLGQLRDHKFDRIGSLYLKGRERQPDPKYEPRNVFPSSHCSINNRDPASRSRYDNGGDQHGRQASEATFTASADNIAQEHRIPPETSIRTLSLKATNDGHNSQPEGSARVLEDATAERGVKHNQYVIGPLLDPLFYLYRRLYLPGKRGPYKTSREWMAAEIDIQKTWAKTGPLIKELSNREDFDRYDWGSDYDEEALEMERLSDGYLDLLPEIFPDHEGGFPFVIYHHDLSLANILIDLDTCEITGIIDWETIEVVPEWMNSRFPKFLTDQIGFEMIDNKEPRRPTAAEYDTNSEDYNALVVERRDRWDNEILRKHFDHILSQSKDDVQSSSYTSDNSGAKRKFVGLVTEITENTSSARWWHQWFEHDLEKRAVADVST